MSYPVSQMEHRWGERVALELPIYIAVHNRTGISGRMKNLSLSGALIQTPIELKVHSLIRVSVNLPPRPLYETVLLAQVIHLHNSEAGIEWCEFAPRLVKEILRCAPTRRVVRR
jgi:hypothetical protein